MDRISSRDLRRGEDAGDVQVAVTARRGADADVLVGEADVERVAIGLRVNGDGSHIELAARTNDA